ncbi:hypothetical protein FQA39_LY12424 [Lamprigera yunnana]|nr:hypothetical protein FQA39_LY12424 [Lamprigera yunnana]
MRIEFITSNGAQDKASWWKKISGKEDHREKYAQGVKPVPPHHAIQRTDAENEFGDTYKPMIELLTGIMTKMRDGGNSTTIQSRQIEENKEARGEEMKKKKMVAKSFDSDGESSKSGNISRDIRMPLLPTTPIRSYPSPGLQRWLSALTPPYLSSPSVLSMSQHQTLSPPSSSSSLDLLHQKYHPLSRQYIENLFADGSGQTEDFYYRIHYDSHKNSWAMSS